jgi:predicted TIM-barrel fold metal-dependent hydrolase
MRRRDLLTGLTALAASAAVSGCRSVGDVGAAPGRIDVHHHLVPPRYRAEVTARGVRAATPEWTPQTSLAEMARTGTATAITSMIPPGVSFLDAGPARALARECNEYAARMVADFPGRFGMFATLPLPDVDGSLREVEYALDTLGADGVGVFTSYGDKWLGDPLFAPVLDELNRRHAVVYAHPLPPACCRSLIAGVPPSTIEYATDTTRTITSLLFSGAAARHRDVRFIFSHGGGTMPYLVGRLLRLAGERKDAAAILPEGPLPELRRFYYELAQAAHPTALPSLLAMAPLSHVLFGTDFPFRPGAEVIEGLDRHGFPAADRRAIEHDNALALLPGVARRAPRG